MLLNIPILFRLLIYMIVLLSMNSIFGQIEMLIIVVYTVIIFLCKPTKYIHSIGNISLPE